MKWSVSVDCGDYGVIVHEFYGNRESVVGTIHKYGVFTSTNQKDTDQVWIPPHAIRRIRLQAVDTD